MASSSANSATSLAVVGFPIETLTGTNFKKWKQDLEIYLGILDLDLALREPEPKLLPTSTKEENERAEKWDRDNRVALKIMQKSMAATVKGGIPMLPKALDFLNAIEQMYQESEEVETNNLMCTLTSLKFDGNGSVREHCLRMIDVANKLKAVKVDIPDTLLVYLILSSLPAMPNW